MNILKKFYQYGEANKKNNIRISFIFFIFIVLVKSVFYFWYPGVDKIALGGFLFTVLIESIVIWGLGMLLGTVPFCICFILRRKSETANNLFLIFWALGSLCFIYANFKVNYPDFFL